MDGEYGTQIIFHYKNTLKKKKFTGESISLRFS